MNPTFDYRESTLSYDYISKTVEFYFTKESDYRRCIKRNPNYTSKKELNPGFVVLYPMTQCRKPEYLLRVV